jgi:mono/diheme cytochrome c family protein
MRNFIIGVIMTIVVLIAAGLAFTFLGFMPTNADATPPGIEKTIAMHSMDASMDRHASHGNNPVPATDDNLIEGMKVYTMNCAMCHGGFNYKPSPLAKSFYPPVPQLVIDPVDDPEWHVHYAISTGVRYTGMPAWGKTLTDDQIWKVTALLTRLNKLPPAVQQYWKDSFGTEPHSGMEGMKMQD